MKMKNYEFDIEGIKELIFPIAVMMFGILLLIIIIESKINTLNAIK